MRPVIMFAVLIVSSASAYAADPVQTYSTPSDRTARVVPDPDTAMISACHGAISQWAAQFHPLDVNTSMTRPIRVRSSGARMARLFVSVDYNSRGGVETRSANIECTVSADGSVAVAEINPTQ